MITGNINVLLAEHPQTAPDLYDTNEGDQMKEIGDRAVVGCLTSFKKTTENGNLDQAEEKEEGVADEKRDCHRPDFVFGIDVEIGKIVQPAPSNDNKRSFDDFVDEKIECVLTEEIVLEREASLVLPLVAQKTLVHLRTHDILIQSRSNIQYQYQ